MIRVQSILDTSDFDKKSETSFILLLNITSPDHDESWWIRSPAYIERLKEYGPKYV